MDRYVCFYDSICELFWTKFIQNLARNSSCQIQSRWFFKVLWPPPNIWTLVNFAPLYIQLYILLGTLPVTLAPALSKLGTPISCKKHYPLVWGRKEGKFLQQAYSFSTWINIQNKKDNGFTMGRYKFWSIVNPNYLK